MTGYDTSNDTLIYNNPNFKHAGLHEKDISRQKSYEGKTTQLASYGKKKVLKNISF